MKKPELNSPFFIDIQNYHFYMNYMFYNCKSLNYLKISLLTFIFVESNNIFYNCISLEKKNLLAEHEEIIRAFNEKSMILDK